MTGLTRQPGRCRTQMAEDVDSLEQLLDQISDTRSSSRVSLDTVVNVVGTRSFGPLLLLAGVILVSPLSGIPGMPTAMALLIFLIAAQLLLRRRCFWLPRWLLARSISSGRLIRAFEWTKRPARVVDRWSRPRLKPLTRQSGSYAIAIVCVAIALVMPVMELVPFSASAAGLALAAFGLALVTRDGLLALTAFAFVAVTAALLARQLL